MNFANRTIWTADNIEILPGIDSECVDLVYLDPPFNSNRNYACNLPVTTPHALAPQLTS